MLLRLVTHAVTPWWTVWHNLYVRVLNWPWGTQFWGHFDDWSWSWGRVRWSWIHREKGSNRRWGREWMNLLKMERVFMSTNYTVREKHLTRNYTSCASVNFHESSLHSSGMLCPASVKQILWPLKKRIWGALFPKSKTKTQYTNKLTKALYTKSHLCKESIWYCNHTWFCTISCVCLRVIYAQSWSTLLLGSKP